MKQLFYDISPEAYRLAIILTDHNHIVGSHKVTIKKKWVLNPKSLNELIIKGYVQHTKEIWGVWQDLLRQAAYVNQEGRSLLTSQNLNVKTMQLHHALITKGMIKGKKGFERNLIHHTYNCILLNVSDHLDGQNNADNREVCAKKLTELYGQGLVKLWYFSYPIKSKLPNIF